jgi:hypothetical protein
MDKIFQKCSQMIYLEETGKKIRILHFFSENFLKYKRETKRNKIAEKTKKDERFQDNNLHDKNYTINNH